ncbi:MAG: hypothetical protein ACI8T1_003406 [Verrucomicrobiales bacterium]|jgi:hypothetical protein
MSQRVSPEHSALTLAIDQRFRAALETRGVPLAPDMPIPADLPLLGSGLDSLGFATLVVQLEDTLKYDPFTLLKEPFYPRTYGEFVGLYVRFWKPLGCTPIAASTN